MNSFKVLHKDKNTNARLGILKTGHGEVATPVFMPVGTQDPNILLFYLEKIISSVKNNNLSDLLDLFFKQEDFIREFSACPAGKTLHHPFIGGLLEHTVTVAKICESLFFLYDFLDYDLLLTSALLHDIGHTPYSHELEEITGLDQMKAALHMFENPGFKDALSACDLDLELLSTFFKKNNFASIRCGNV